MSYWHVGLLFCNFLIYLWLQPAILYRKHYAVIIREDAPYTGESHLERRLCWRDRIIQLLGIPEKKISSKGHHLKKLQHTVTNSLTTLQISISKFDLSALKLWLDNKQGKVVRNINQTHEKNSQINLIDPVVVS